MSEAKTRVKRYFSKVCAKHPELKGERYRLNSRCVACNKEKNAAWLAKNGDKARERIKAWRQKNKEKARRIAARSLFMSRYGLPIEAKAVLLDLQDGRCGVCGTSDPERRWHFDHCHTTGRARGVLCGGCNHLLGNAKDNTDILRRAIQYLEYSRRFDNPPPPETEDDLRSQRRNQLAARRWAAKARKRGRIFDLTIPRVPVEEALRQATARVRAGK